MFKISMQCFILTRLLDLMQENQTLRSLLRGLSSFIGDGAGGLLPKLGWDMADFNNLVNRAETDSAWESYQKQKKTRTEANPMSGVFSSQSQKRVSDEDSGQSRAKRPRSMGDNAHDGE